MAVKKDDRLFAPFPIEMDEHPKIIGLSDAAFRAIFEGTFYARRMLSDGFLDERVVLHRWGKDVAAELSSNDPERPSWVRVEGGWQIHDFEKHHPLRAEIEAKRADVSEKRSQAGRKGAAKRWQADSNRMASDSSETETETVTSKEVTPRSARGTRVPSDFVITDELRDWARQEVPHVDVDKKLGEWIDFWRGVPGKGGYKVDWVSTWRNGMRKQEQFALQDAAKRGTAPERKVKRFVAHAD